MINRPFGAIFLENNVARPFKESSQFAKFFEVCFFGYLYISLFACAVRININNNNSISMEFLKSWFWFLSLLQKLFMAIIFDIFFATLRYLFLLFIKATRIPRRDNFIR